MGNELLNRKSFFKSLVGQKDNPTNNEEPLGLGGEPDPLFEKYARKTLGERQYSQQVATPNNDGSLSMRVGTVNSGLSPYTGVWSAWEVHHLLRRISFGVKKDEATALLAMTTSAAIDSLFNFTATPVSPSATPLYYNTAQYPDTLGNGTGTPVISGGVALGANWTISNLTGYPPFGPHYSRRQSLAFWQWGVCINEPASLREKMQQFWFHFIPINFESLDNSEPNCGILSYQYMDILRQNGLGSFKNLIKLIAKSPAMLVYLSNQYSTAAAPNENFARELLELFTMGKTPTQNYTEADIVATSKVLSGWRVPSFISSTPIVSGFNAYYHNQTNKTFSANFATSPATSFTINNQAGAAGANEFDLFFDMLFNTQAATISKYICRRLYRFFVYYDIDATIEANVIVPLAAILVNNNWDINITIKTLLKSEHFFDVANRGVMIKNPIDFVTGIVRTFNINTNAASIDKQYSVWQYFQDYCIDYLEQGIGAPPNVAGWKAYYQEPTYYQNWINSETIQRRATLLTSFINGFNIYPYPYQSSIFIKMDIVAFVKQFPNSTIIDPNLLIDEITKYMFSVDLPAAFKTQVKQQELLTGQTTDYYWTLAWSNYLTTPDATNTNIVNTRLKGLITALIQLAEFQLM